MACCSSSAVSVFDHAWLSTRTGFAAKSTSNGIPSAGNKVTVSATAINISASSTLTIYIDGSYDGVTWKELTSTTLTAFGYTSVASASLDVAWVRVRVELTGTTVDALFNIFAAFASL